MSFCRGFWLIKYFLAIGRIRTHLATGNSNEILLVNPWKHVKHNVACIGLLCFSVRQRILEIGSGIRVKNRSIRNEMVQNKPTCVALCHLWCGLRRNNIRNDVVRDAIKEETDRSHNRHQERKVEMVLIHHKSQWSVHCHHAMYNLNQKERRQTGGKISCQRHWVNRRINQSQTLARNQDIWKELIRR